jgi:hypothetical protein
MAANNHTPLIDMTGRRCGRLTVPASARLAIQRSLCARQCSLFGEIPPSCDSDHRRGVGSV